MCELLGMSFNVPIRPKWTFRGFRHRGNYNQDGWGIAFYPDKSAQIIKEEVKSTDSDLSKKLVEYPRWNSKIIIAHVRLASKGEPSHENSHPFSRELEGKEYVFAHNGTISDYKNLRIGRFKPIGGTDSEHVFCHILDAIEKRDVKAWSVEDFQWLEGLLRGINGKGRFHCLFSDGDYLFCFCGSHEYNRLKVLHREPPYSGRVVRLKDEDLEINLGEEKNSGQTGYIISTNPLTKGEPWFKLNLGTLQVFRDGRVIYPVPWDKSALEIEMSETPREHGTRPRVSPVTHPLSRATPSVNIPIPMPKFASVRDTIVALEQSYRAFVESTHKSDWVSNGKAWYERFPNKYMMRDGKARDAHVQEITHIAFGLCVDAVQRRALKTKFWARVASPTHIYGGRESRFSSETDAVALPEVLARDADIRRLMASENLTAVSSGDRNIYLRMSFRESPSRLRYIMVALYVLWMQNYIQIA